MTREDIIHLAREAGLIYWTHNRWWMDAGEFGEEIERFAALIASRAAAAAKEEEREACAKVCDSMRPTKQEFDQRFYTACTLNANAIRARGETTSRGNA